MEKDGEKLCLVRMRRKGEEEQRVAGGRRGEGTVEQHSRG